MSNILKQVLEDQIQTLNKRSQQLRDKMERGEELTAQERIELSATNDRIQQMVRELKSI